MRMILAAILFSVSACGKSSGPSASETGLFRTWTVASDVSNSGSSYSMDLHAARVGSGSVVYTQGATVCTCTATISGLTPSDTYARSACNITSGTGSCAFFNDLTFFVNVLSGDNLELVAINNLHVTFVAQ